MKEQPGPARGFFPLKGFVCLFLFLFLFWLYPAQTEGWRRSLASVWHNKSMLNSYISDDYVTVLLNSNLLPFRESIAAICVSHKHLNIFEWQIVSSFLFRSLSILYRWIMRRPLSPIQRSLRCLWISVLFTPSHFYCLITGIVKNARRLKY